jgi:protein ImuB
MRVAALWVPDFLLQALRRSTPELAEAPLAIAAGPLPRDEVVVVSAEAAELGVRSGMTAAQARQVAPAALVRVTPEAAAAAADEATTDAAGGFSPRIRRHAPGEVLLDVGGLTPRFGSEERIAHELLRACRHVGLDARVGIAASVGVARVAARYAEPWGPPVSGDGNSLPASEGGTGGHEAAEGVRRAAGPPVSGDGNSLPASEGGTGGHEAAEGVRRAAGSPVSGDGNSLPASEGGTGGHEAAEGVRRAAGPPASGDGRVGIAASVGVARVATRSGELTVVRPGEERTFMAPLPLALLYAGFEPTPETTGMLERWGLATAGDLARLPRREVALRLGQEGVVLHRLACGEETAAFIPDPVREVLREGVEVDYPVGALEPFLFLMSGLLSRLERRLELRGEGFSEVLLELHLEGGGHREHRLKLVAPTREVPAVLALVRLQLEANPPGAPVEGVAALVTPGRVRLTQGSLFGAPVPAPGKLSTALARLAALVGPDRVGAPDLPDTHRPGVFAVLPFAPGEDRGPGTGVRDWNGVGAALAAARGWVGERTDAVAGGGKPRPYDNTKRGGADRTPDHETLVPVLRAFRPPRQAQVVAVGGRPVTARVDGMGGQVVGWAGPYRFVGEWWGDQPYAREDFDVATADGSLLRIYFDRLRHRWFADGVYD